MRTVLRGLVLLLLLLLLSSSSSSSLLCCCSSSFCLLAAKNQNISYVTTNHCNNEEAVNHTGQILHESHIGSTWIVYLYICVYICMCIYTYSKCFGCVMFFSLTRTS
jgi:hypothetical protein